MLLDPKRAPAPYRHRHRWILAGGAVATFHRFRADWDALPRTSRHRWLWTVTWGLGVGAVLVLALCWATARLERMGTLAWEADAVRAVEARAPLEFSAALWAETPGNSVFMIPVVVAAAFLWAWLRRPLLVLATLSSFFMLDLLVGLGWTVWPRDRPDLIAGGIASPGLHSFPSGHVAQMVSVYGFWTYLWARASRSWLERTFAVVFLLALVSIVGLARVRLGSHWPTDIAAGAVVGAFWLAVSIIALRRAETAPRD